MQTLTVVNQQYTAQKSRELLKHNSTYHNKITLDSKEIDHKDTRILMITDSRSFCIDFLDNQPTLKRVIAVLRFD